MEEAVDRARRREAARQQRQERNHELAPHEEWVLGTPHLERARMLDPSGRVVAEKEGEQDLVEWPLSVLRGLVGRVDLITHNHPNRTSVGLNDAYTAVGLNAREVNVVSRTERHRLYRTGDAWPAVEELDRVTRAEVTRLTEEMLDARDQGKIDDEAVDRLFYRVLWARVAERFPNRVRFVVERRA